MRALAIVDEGVITAEIEIAAAPERVFRSLTDPAELAVWWGDDLIYRTYDWQLDLRAGGAWSTRARGADGSEMTLGGEYLEVDPPRLLVYTWRPSWDDFVETTVRCELHPTPAGTRVRITHTGFVGRAPAAEGTGEGWKRVLEWVAEHLEGATG
jgi:uncharacterized protein YndB with AHSA1/START domain